MRKITDLITSIFLLAQDVEKKLIDVHELMKQININDVALLKFLPTLTPQEDKILELMVEDQTMSEIAKTLKLSRRTIEAHRYNIIKKLRLTSAKDLKWKVIPWLQGRSKNSKSGNLG